MVRRPEGKPDDSDSPEGTCPRTDCFYNVDRKCHHGLRPEPESCQHFRPLSPGESEQKARILDTIREAVRARPGWDRDVG